MNSIINTIHIFFFNILSNNCIYFWINKSTLLYSFIKYNITKNASVFVFYLLQFKK